MRICKEGWPYIYGCLIPTFAMRTAGWQFEIRLLGKLSVIPFLAACFCLYFFRDPRRTIPQGERCILAPADGKILEIAEESTAGMPGRFRVVRIFLSIFEPHLQRSPVKGRVQAVQYKKGKFLDARHPQAAFGNEQNRIEIIPSPSPLPQGARDSIKNSSLSPTGERVQGEGSTVVVTQIAGLIARRIRCWVREGQAVEAGERIGLIQFGSQVDIHLPLAARLRVQAGDHVKAGETVLAEWS